MSVFRRLLGGGHLYERPQVGSWEQRPAWMSDGMRVQLLDGAVDLEVVGESHYQESLWQLAGGRGDPEKRVRIAVSAVLVPEADNPFDPNAVSVWVDSLKVGYLSRDDALRYRPGLLALQREHGMPIALPGVIVGGGMRADGPGRLGVFLRHDPADFGLQPPPVPQRALHMRTGLSEAFATDAANGTHDLSWLLDLPGDEIRAISMLRKLLVDETDPLARHFMQAQLETLLYRSREAFASALGEYDQACLRHDLEMENIRQAFMTEWGEVPFLEIYRQMAIRQQKAGDFGQALWWAERGIAVYGGDAARPEAVEDLRRRVAAYKAKLAPVSQHSRAHLPVTGQPQSETLRCSECGRDFQRNRMRGRKPMRCPECAERMATL
jgi:hypothetical protein